MKHPFIFFCVILVLGFILGFYYHEALNEKITYELNSCKFLLGKHTYNTNPDIYGDFRTKEVSSILDDKDCVFVENTYDSTTGKTKHICYLKN